MAWTGVSRSRALLCLLLLAVSQVLVRGQSDCPPRCLCFRTTVRCMFLGLTHLPRVPATTTIL